ncbi:MAG TPA: tetraacyldisaccharide 4'-kinase [Candidatus Omnitrophota bacterium]|nr:tetraacyldisaccharide 4'-kinase [Candidatus Omnitrophota bacterium]HPD84975.1 tetraacyldisaccharide 4'-kinase [Candidatus Omnitrophota bacterium]HRZ03833.1 tetraacyldisaccharide 4'-kinase [Candidatus Omnitrophota bacterium]
MREYFFRLMTDRVNGFTASILKALLLLLSFIYGFLVGIILWFYRIGILRRYRLPKPVISIGNMTVGGVGKTPLVEFIAEFLKKNNLKPVILTRGYMTGKLVSLGPEGRFSDEAKLLSGALKGIPVMVGKNRIKKAREAMNDYPMDVFLMDDGFQHWRLRRDLDIVAIDTTNPFGNGYLIPRGILRESVTSLSRADMFVLTKTDLGKQNLELIRDKLRAVNPDCPIVEAIHGPVDLTDLRVEGRKYPLSILKGRSIGAFCSIADPRSFEALLVNLGAEVRKTFSFMDHHLYRLHDIKEIIRYCKENNAWTILTTQKDAVKLTKFLGEFGSGLALLSLNIKIEITRGKEEFLKKVLEASSKKGQE